MREARTRTGAGRQMPGWIPALAVGIAALLFPFPAAASAQTGGAPSPAAAAPVPPSPTGAPTPEASAGNVTLLEAKTTPRKAFYFGFRYPSLRFVIGSDAAENDLRIEVADAAGTTVKTFFRNDVAPNASTTIRWDGTTDEGRPARNGRYSFRISPQSATTRLIQRKQGAKSSAEPPVLGFKMYRFAFPVLGRHDFGGPQSVFGSGRSGHTHQGHDVMARCGLPVVAARGGTIRFAGYHSAAGNYVVIDSRGSGYDTVYMHLLVPSPLKTGMVVRTGQPIGMVGSTGSSTACHLHFELWTAPGWYEGGSPIDPLPLLKSWDRYS